MELELALRYELATYELLDQHQTVTISKLNQQVALDELAKVSQ